MRVSPCTLAEMAKMITWLKTREYHREELQKVRHRHMCNCVVPSMMKMRQRARRARAYCLPPHQRCFPSVASRPRQQGCGFAAALLSATLMCSWQGSRHYMSRSWTGLFLASAACPASFQVLTSGGDKFSPVELTRENKGVYSPSASRGTDPLPYRLLY